MTKANIRIRNGKAEDLPDAHRLVGELADYHDELPSFVATIDDYRDDFADGFFRMLVVEDIDKEEVIGLALYNFHYSTWKGRMIYLEDLVIDPSYRRQGIGQVLWDALEEKGREKGCKVLKWQVVETNTAALKFYEAQNATIEKDWYNGKIAL